MDKQYYEEARWLKVYDGCELLIIGSGAAGHSAAIAAARAGCRNIILMDRYGYSGGDVTGGYVIMVPDLSWYDKQFVKGLQEEWFQRMKHIPGAVRGPEGAQMGSTIPFFAIAGRQSTTAGAVERIPLTGWYARSILNRTS